MKPHTAKTRPARAPFALILAIAAATLAWAPGGADAQSNVTRKAITGHENNSDAAPNTSVEEVEIPRKFWDATTPGGNFLVALSSIRFVSIHEYIVDGNVRVREFSIGSGTSALARFYHLELIAGNSPVTATRTILNRATSIAEAAADRASGAGDVWKKVQKNYPASTHAHTIEYRLEYLADLEKLYQSARGAWYNGRGARITVKSGK